MAGNTALDKRPFGRGERTPESLERLAALLLAQAAQLRHQQIAHEGKGIETVYRILRYTGPRTWLLDVLRRSWCRESREHLTQFGKDRGVMASTVCACEDPEVVEAVSGEALIHHETRGEDQP